MRQRCERARSTFADSSEQDFPQVIASLKQGVAVACVMEDAKFEMR